MKAFPLDASPSESKLILCPKCDAGFLKDSECTEAFCDECEEDIMLADDFETTEFIWHPGKKY